MIRRATGVGDFADLRREILADAGNLLETLGVERRHRVRMIRDDVAGVAIRADLERVFALNLEQIGDLPENPRDGCVIQAGGLLSRCGSRGAARLPGPARWRWRRER